MTTDELIELLGDRTTDEFLKFDRVQNKRSQRPDLHAFLLLDELVPGKSDMVACAEHDEIWLDASAEELATVATGEQVVELVRCGVRYDDGAGSLALFV